MPLSFLVRSSIDNADFTKPLLYLMIFDDKLYADRTGTADPLIEDKKFASITSAQNYMFNSLAEKYGNYELLLATQSYISSYVYNNANPALQELIRSFPALQIKQDDAELPINQSLTMSIADGKDTSGNYYVRRGSNLIEGWINTVKSNFRTFFVQSYDSPVSSTGLTGTVEIGAIVCPESWWDGAKITIPGNDRRDALILKITFTAYVHSSRPIEYGAYAYMYDDIQVSTIKSLFEGYIPPLIVDPGPYSPGGLNQPSSGSGLTPGASGGIGGGGTFDGQSTAIPLPGLPSLSGIGSGFCGLFNPSASQLNALARFMWSDDFVTNIVKLFGDPMDVILGLNIVPVKPSTSGSAEVTAGFISTGVSMPVVSSQYAQVDCGTIDVREFWGSCLDYSPYTQVQIFLPYIGTHQLDVDEIMNKTIHLIYNIDILSGSCVACLQCGESTLYTFNGSCASSIPVTGQNFNTIISTAVQLAAGVGSFVASGGSMIGAAIGAGEGALTAAASGGMKPTVQHSGSVQATNGLLGIQTPYLIFTLPTQSVPENQNEYQGYPSNMTLLLSNCMGYTKCAEVHLVNIPATKPELDEIESLLKRGVMI